MIGEIVSHYKIIEKLGEGGMGVVYKAHDTKLDRVVALKFLPENLTVNSTDKERFIEEAKAAAALNHSNVCVVHDIDNEDEYHFIVMEYIDGKTLQQVIADEGVLTTNAATEYAIQMGEALQEAHHKGIVHRDIKSDNIMISGSNQAKVMDFGLAKLKGSLKLTKSSSTVGTLAYMAPEQIEGKDIDGRSDIFSMGIVLYEMLTGQLPFKGDYEAAMMYAILNEEPVPIERHLPDISSELRHILIRSLEKDPNNRYQSMEDMLIDLHRLERDTEKISRIETGIYKSEKSIKKKNRFKKYFVPVIALLIVILVVVGYFSIISQSEDKYERIPIAVTDFNNETNEEELNGLSGMLITALEQSKRLSVLTRSRMFDILKQLDVNEIDKIDESLGRRICKEADVHTLAMAAIRKFGKIYTIDFKVLDVDDNEYLFTYKEQGEGQESIPGMIDNLSEKIRIGLKEKASEIESSTTKVAELTSRNLEAYQYYFKGEEYIDKLKFDLAKEAFSKAIHLDSSFALAYYRLAYAIDWEANPYRSIKYIKKAISLLDRIPDKEKNLVKAQLARLENGMAAGIAVLEEMEKIYPDDKEMLYNIGDWAYHIGDFIKSRKYLEKVLSMDPVFIRALQHITWTYRESGIYENMFQAAQKYNSLTGSKESYDLLVEAYIELGKVKEGLQFIEQEQELHPERHYMASLVAKCYVFQEKYDQAEKELRSLIRDDKPVRARLLGYMILSNFYNYLGKYRESQKAYDYIIDYYWQQKDTSLACYYQMSKGFRLYEGWYKVESAIREVSKTFPHQNNIDYILYWTGLSVYHVVTNDFDLAKRIAKTISLDWWYSAVLTLIHNKKEECLDSAALLDSIMHKCPSGIKLFLVYQLAECQFKQEEYDQAIQSLTHLQKIKDTTMGFRATYLPKSYFILGKIYEQKGERTLALEHYAKFLDMWKNADQDLPELIDAKLRYEHLVNNELSSKQ